MFAGTHLLIFLLCTASYAATCNALPKEDVTSLMQVSVVDHSKSTLSQKDNAHGHAVFPLGKSSRIDKENDCIKPSSEISLVEIKHPEPWVHQARSKVHVAAKKEDTAISLFMERFVVAMTNTNLYTNTGPKDFDIDDPAGEVTEEKTEEKNNAPWFELSKHHDHEPQHGNMFTSVTLDEWLIFSGLIFFLVVFNCKVLQRLRSTPRNHVKAILFWIAAGMAYNFYYWVRHGQDDGVHWMIGYVVEWVLGLDNLFVFHMVFKNYKTPQAQLPKALFIGIGFSVFFRLLFFLSLGAFLETAVVAQFIFGAFLVYSGISSLQEDDTDEDVTNSLSVRFLKGCLGSRLHEAYDDQKRLFSYGDDGKIRATLLLFVVLLLELIDAMFAIDCVIFKMAMIPNQFVALSSSVLAIFGSRATFFIIKDLMDYFEFLKYGLAFILVFIGLELMLVKWIHVGAGLSCLIIGLVFVVCIGASMVKIALQSPDTMVEKGKATLGYETTLPAKSANDNASQASTEDTARTAGVAK